MKQEYVIRPSRIKREYWNVFRLQARTICTRRNELEELQGRNDLKEKRKFYLTVSTAKYNYQT